MTPTANKRKTVNAPQKVIFIICPGASSKEPSELKDALNSLGSTRVLAKWAGVMPSHAKANMNLVLEKCREMANEFPDRKIILTGHSFGTRVIVGLLTKIRNGEIGDIPESLQTDRVILESYPLYGPSKPKPTTDRAATLRNAPDNLRCLFFSGEKDEFLDRRKNWRSDVADEDIGGGALKQIVATMPSSDLCTVVMIPEGKHNALKASKSKQTAVTTQFQNAVKLFLADGFDLESSSDKGSLTSFFARKTKKSKSK